MTVHELTTRAAKVIRAEYEMLEANMDQRDIDVGTYQRIYETAVRDLEREYPGVKVDRAQLSRLGL
jgi:hypothetical protein